jgi:hypothetical protein
MDKNQTPTMYTGDIAAEDIDPTKEYTTEKARSEPGGHPCFASDSP